MHPWNTPYCMKKGMYKMHYTLVLTCRSILHKCKTRNEIKTILSCKRIHRNPIGEHKQRQDGMKRKLLKKYACTSFRTRWTSPAKAFKYADKFSCEALQLHLLNPLPFTKPFKICPQDPPRSSTKICLQNLLRSPSRRLTKSPARPCKYAYTIRCKALQICLQNTRRSNSKSGRCHSKPT